MGLLKPPDGQKQLEVISNCINIDYIVHHWLGMLHKLPFLLQMQFSYPFDEVNQIHLTFELHFKTTKILFFFHLFMGKREIQRKERKS